MRRRHQQVISSRPMLLASQSTSIFQAVSGSSQSKSTNHPSGKNVRRKSRWDGFKDKLQFWLLWSFFASPVVAPLVIGIVYVPSYRASLSPVEFTVDRRERVVKGSGDSTQSYYLVWSKEGEVYCVTDSWSFMSFDSSDRYGKLHEGSKITAKVAGWRVRFLSWYRNVIEIADVKSPEVP